MANILDLKHPQPEPEPLPEPVVVEPSAEPELPDFMAFDEPESLEWEARHSLSERGSYRHYLVLAGFTFVGGVVSWWQASWLSLMTIMLGLAAWELHERLGQPVRVQLDERGVTVNGLHFPHATLSSFDVYRMPDGTAELSLATKRWHSPRLRIPLGEQDPEAVRSALLYNVAEDRHRIPLLDRFIKKD